MSQEIKDAAVPVDEVPLTAEQLASCKRIKQSVLEANEDINESISVIGKSICEIVKGADPLVLDQEVIIACTKASTVADKLLAAYAEMEAAGFLDMMPGAHAMRADCTLIRANLKERIEKHRLVLAEAKTKAEEDAILSLDATEVGAWCRDVGRELTTLADMLVLDGDFKDTKTRGVIELAASDVKNLTRMLNGCVRDIQIKKLEEARDRALVPVAAEANKE